MKRALIVAVLVTAGAGYLTACGSVAGSLSANANVRTPPGPAQRLVVPGVHVKPFVRSGAVAMWLPYPVINWPDPHGHVKSHLIHSRATIDRFTRVFNTLPEPAKGIYNCPMDDGSKLFVVFRYRHARAERIVIDLGGCAWATNGHAVRNTTRWLATHLLHLVGGSYPR